MHTRLVFKFLLFILVLSGICGSVQTSGSELFIYGQFAQVEPIIHNDTVPAAIDMPGFDLPETTEPIDTIAPPAEHDTIAEIPTRQTGTGVILDSKVEYSASDSIRFDLRQQTVHLYGNAELKHGTINLTSAYISINFETNEMFAKGMPDSLGIIQGNPIFTDGAQNFESYELRYNFRTRKGRTVQVRSQEADGFMHGDVVKMMDNRVIHVQDGKYTTCDAEHPHFHLSFRRAKVMPGDKIITSLAFLIIEGIPTPFLLPFGFFPNRQGRANGIIMPSYGEERNRGFNLRGGGFYWGINDYMDLALTGDIYSRGSWAATAASSYRVRYRFNGNFNVTFANNIFGEQGLPDYQRSRDFRINWNHSQDPKARPNSVFRASVNAGSTQFNRFNPASSQDYLTNTLSSNISYTARWGRMFNFAAHARHSQNTLTRRVDLNLPEMTFSVARFHPFRRQNPEGPLRWYENISMNMNSNLSNQISVADTLLFDRDVFDRMNSGVQHTIPLSLTLRVLRHFNLSNSFNFTERWNFHSIERSWEGDGTFDPVTGRYGGQVVTDTIRGFNAVRDFSFSSSLNTKFFGLVQFARGPVTAIRHVVTPNIGFSLRPDFADPFWGYYRFYENPNIATPVRYATFEGTRFGGPSPGRSGALNFSVSNNLEMKVRTPNDDEEYRKITLIDNLSLSASYDFARDSLNLSDLNVSGRTRLFGQFDITYNSRWSPYATDDEGRIINRFLWEEGDRIFQLLNTGWNLNFNYNISSETFLGGGEQEDGATSQDELTDELPFGTEEIPEETTQRPVAMPATPRGMIDYTVPWSLRFSYSVRHGTNIRRPDLIRDRTFSQSLTFSGDISLTPRWRVGFSSGYNFDERQLTYTSLNIYRDLHCWELIINWVPFGFRQSYNMTLRAKSSLLQDLKIERETHHLDRLPF